MSTFTPRMKELKSFYYEYDPPEKRIDFDFALKRLTNFAKRYQNNVIFNEILRNNKDIEQKRLKTLDLDEAVTNISHLIKQIKQNIYALEDHLSYLSKIKKFESKNQKNSRKD